ncbi:MAG: hypothetical protein WD276_06725 [Actinomycetota bacterium]
MTKADAKAQVTGAANDLHNLMASGAGSTNKVNASAAILLSSTALYLAEAQEETTRDLVEATKSLREESSETAKQTRRLVWATLALSGVGILSVIVTGIIGTLALLEA